MFDVQTAHQRLITLGLYSTSNTSTVSSKGSTALPTPSTENIIHTLPILISYLDIFHSDPDAWSLLADLYLILSGWREIDNAFYRGEILVKLFPNSAGRLGVEAGKEPGGEYLQQAMTSLAQRMLMEPWNWMTLIRYGEMGLMLG